MAGCSNRSNRLGIAVDPEGRKESWAPFVYCPSLHHFHRRRAYRRQPQRARDARGATSRSQEQFYGPGARVSCVNRPWLVTGSSSSSSSKAAVVVGVAVVVVVACRCKSLLKVGRDLDSRGCRKDCGQTGAKPRGARNTKIDNLL